MSDDSVTEVVFVGLPGPTHHYGGLSADNKASTLNRGSVSNPKLAALQALELVRLLKSLGVVAGILPPQLRPHMPLLRQHFSGEDEAVIAQAAVSAPALLDKASAASSMWTANAATVTPSIDSSDGNMHITAANLFTNLHRRIEAEDTYHMLKSIFEDIPDTVVHPPLSAVMGLLDEGAANHMRLCPSHSQAGLNLFVYGATDITNDKTAGRQTLSASQAIARQHKLFDGAAGFIRQNREAIHSGVFHNDVIAVSNENLLLVHEQAYDQGMRDIERIAKSYRETHQGKELSVVVISEEELTMEEAVQCYLFNSQIITKPDRSMAVIAPIEVKLLFDGEAAELMEHIRADSSNPISEVHYVDLRQSMRNGGGPACLRLRVPVNAPQLAALTQRKRVIANEELITALERIIHAYYPDELIPSDLAKPALYHASRHVMEALSEVMQLPLVRSGS